MYPALAQVVLDRGLDRQLLVWTAARCSARAGLFGSSGHREGIPFELLVRQVALWAGRSPSTVRKILANGEGSFWSTEAGGRRRVFLAGPDLLGWSLGLDDAGRRLRRVRIDKRLGVARWRAILMASRLPVRPTRLSREHIARSTSVSARTQRRWESQGIAVHDDGHGRAPVRCAPIFGDFTSTLPTHPELGSIGPPAALSEMARGGVPLGSAGFFTDRQGRRLLRQAPKEFAFAIRSVRRKPQDHRRGGADTPAREPGIRETNPAVPMISWRSRPPRGSLIAMRGSGPIREAVLLNPNVTILDCKFGLPL